MRVRLKVRNLIGEIHKKLVKRLREKYKVVLLSSFETSGMFGSGQQKINSKTVCGMVAWSHYRFCQRIINKVRVCKRTLIVCGDAYTSKTGGQCGVLHPKLGGSKTCVCPSCNVVVDRDMNGAPNILLRYLTLHSRSV